MIAIVLFYVVHCPIFAGTIVEGKNEQLAEELYNVPWYLMDKKNQKEFQLILQMAQKPIGLTFWRMQRINMKAFLDIYSKIYVYFMFLKETV
jgi:hypothetical protein